MITLIDLTTYDAAGSWTSAKVASVSAASRSLCYKAVLKQYAPEFAAHTYPTSGTVLMGGGSYVLGGVLQTTVIATKAGQSHVYQYNLPNEDAGAENWTTIEHDIGDVPTAISMSEPDAMTDPHIFWTIGTSVFDKNLATAAEAERALSVTARFVAGTVGGRFHFIYKTTKNNWRLGYVDENGTKTVSDIYWPFKVTGFSAARCDDHDVIVMSTELPPIHDFTVNDKKLEPAFHYITGIVAFNFSLATKQWSDHTVVWKDERDVYDIDFVTTEKILPGQIHLTRYKNEYDQDEVFAVVPLDMGYADALADRYVMAFFKSADGNRWEAPVCYNSWPWAAGATYFTTNGAKLIRNGDYMYIAHPHYIDRSLATCWMGDACALLTQDVTNYVASVTIEASKQRACTLQMTNPAGVLTDPTALLGKGTSVRGYVWTGYHELVSGSETHILVPSFTGLVTGMVEKATLPDKALSVALSDPLETAQLAGSSDAVEWPGLIVGGDNFVGTESGINTSGNGHVAPIKGIWKSGATSALPNGGLMMECDGKEGLASNALFGLSRVWNGMIGATLRAFPEGSGSLPILDTYDKMGLFFRGTAVTNGMSDHMWIVRWTAGNAAKYDLIRRYVGCYNNPVTDGAFAIPSPGNAYWTCGANWSITTDGVAVHTGAESRIYQTALNAAIGAKYIVKWRITALTTGGTAHIVLGTTVGQARTAVGVFEESFDATGAELVMAGTNEISIYATGSLTIDDVEIKPVAMDYECPNYGAGAGQGTYSFDNSGHPYDGGELVVRFKYNYVEAYLTPHDETTPVKILWYELIGRGDNSVWTKVTLENGVVGFPIDDGNMGYYADTHNDSRDNLLRNYNPGAEGPYDPWPSEGDPLPDLVSANALASGWSNQMDAHNYYTELEHHWGIASDHCQCSNDVYSTGVRIARWFSPTDSVIFGDTYECEAWLKINPLTQLNINRLKAFVEIQYAVGQDMGHTISEYQEFKNQTDNNGWFLWRTSVTSEISIRRVAKVIIEIFHGNGESDWLWCVKPGQPLDFWVDDVGIYSTLMPSHKQYMAWSNVHVSDGGRSYTLQDACRNILGYSGVTCDRSLKYDGFSTFTLSGGMGYAAPALSSAPGSDSLAVSPDILFAPSFALEFDKACAVGQVRLFATPYFFFRWTATTIEFVQDATVKAMPIALPTSCHIRLSVSARADNSRKSAIGTLDWLTLAVYADEAYVASWSFPIDDLDDMIGPIAFGSYTQAAFSVSNLAMDNMYRLVLYHIIDPGTKVMDALSAVISNYRVLVHGRFNGHVEAKMFPLPPHASVWAGATVARVESSQNTRSLLPTNFWRVNGAWKNTDWIAHAAHQKAWRRVYEKIDNPNLMTAEELRREVTYITQDMKGLVSKPSISMPYMPLLEVGDCIAWNGEYMLIDGLRREA